MLIFIFNFLPRVPGPRTIQSGLLLTRPDILRRPAVLIGESIRLAQAAPRDRPYNHQGLRAPSRKLTDQPDQTLMAHAIALHITSFVMLGILPS
ncbi:MAG: hypothetical protein CMC14_02290 [Flavobacteriaceae bacterium]|nr:hypothetical protein [Flavobacteriaceae bacterium]